MPDEERYTFPTPDLAIQWLEDVDDLLDWTGYLVADMRTLGRLAITSNSRYMWSMLAEEEKGD